MHLLAVVMAGAVLLTLPVGAGERQRAVHALGGASADIATYDVNVAGSVSGQVASAADVTGPVPVAGRWVAPVQGLITSGFRIASRPGHAGVDLAAPRGNSVLAVAGGVILVAACDTSTVFCDRDGSLVTAGCGWYADILHEGAVLTRYCHLRTRPMVNPGQRVSAGQFIGFVGSSGNSSGSHLHFEVHVGMPATLANAVDPMPFMARRGVQLG